MANTTIKHTVIVLESSNLAGPRAAWSLLDTLNAYPDPLIVAVPALEGVTERLAEASHTAPGDRSALRLIADLREEHRGLLHALGAPAPAFDAASLRIDRLLSRLWTLLDCPAAGGDRAARIVSSGEGLSAVCVALALVALGRPAPIVGQEKSGLDVAALKALPGAVVPGVGSAAAISESLGARLTRARPPESASFARSGFAMTGLARKPGVA